MKITVSVLESLALAGDRVEFCAPGTFSNSAVPKGEFDGRKNACLVLHEAWGRHVHVGIGDQARWNPNTFRQAAGAATKTLVNIGAETISYDLRGHTERVQQVVEGAMLASYKFETFKMPDSRRKTGLRAIRLIVSSEEVPAARKLAAAGQALGEATNMVRELGNLPGCEITPAAMAERAAAFARERRLKCRIWDEKALKRGGFGGILAVGKGSASPPRFIVVESMAGKKNGPVFAVVGKAITFDSGGISIKPSERMDEMKFDKMGGCAVLGILQAVVALKLPINVVGAIASAENMPSATAYRPGDIVKTWDGKTIEVLNTDAEGRIVLADALAYVRDTYRPRLTIDLATLTGACGVALGVHRAGLFASDRNLSDSMQEVGEETGDRLWPLPVGEEYAEQIKSDVALVKNTGGREGGACTAASFLQHWAGTGPWVHLDIAYTAWNTRDLAYLEKGATGFGVRLVTEFLRQQ